MKQSSFFDELRTVIELAYQAHTHHPLEPKKATRKWDRRTPYFAHPVWCATAILHEPGLPEALRRRGSQALALHDVLEDTTLELPASISPAVRRLVEGMTFEGGSAQEMVEVWSRPPEVRLLKLYDKTCNMMDDHFLAPDKRAKSRRYVRKLAADVEAHFPGTNIVTLARAMCRAPRSGGPHAGSSRAKPSSPAGRSPGVDEFFNAASSRSVSGLPPRECSC